jgi:hypothetical protein
MGAGQYMTAPEGIGFAADGAFILCSREALNILENGKGGNICAIRQT